MFVSVIYTRCALISRACWSEVPRTLTVSDDQFGTGQPNLGESAAVYPNAAVPMLVRKQIFYWQYNILYGALRLVANAPCVVT
jgi:hypothetical protein